MNSRLFEKIHISWLVAAWCLGLTVGVITIHYLPRLVMFEAWALVVGLGLMAVVMACLAVAGVDDCGNYFWRLGGAVAR